MSTVVDQSTVPGGMERELTRDVPDGTITFQQAPAGWLTKAGEPRKRPWRAYLWQRDGSKAVRLPSSTTLLDAITPKDGLPPWYEARGIEGVRVAIQSGQLDPEDDIDWVREVRRLGLGAEAARDEAAQRGLNVHSLLEEYMRTGGAPRLASHPDSHHGYIEALAKWLLKYDPEPVAIEQLVCHPEAGYAGRLDLRARIDGQLVTVDLKSQERAGIHLGGHIQVNLYERAAVRCGDEPADRKLIVVVAANGDYREMAADHADSLVDNALAYYRETKPIVSLCESANRAERKARA